MRSFALFGAAAVLAFASQANAAGPGYLGAGYINAETEIGGFEVEGDAWGIDGAAAFDVSPGVGVQLGALVVDDDSDETAFSVNGHWNLRNEKRLIGVFGNVSNANDETAWAIGAEGEMYMSDVTLAGAVGYETIDDTDVDILSLDGEARYFVTNNFRLEGELGFANVDAGVGDDSVVSIGAGAEYQFASTPFSVFGGYSHAEADDTDISTDVFSIGARFNFGGSLLDRDRKGASLPGLSSRTGSLGV